MKVIGTNTVVTLTKDKAEFWLNHQANQRKPITRHINALAKLLNRVGWRNDQRICITEDNAIVNGLQRLSAIYQLQDFGWKIPVTVYKREELNIDLIESFNVQKSDSISRLMTREYGWTDKRLCSVCQTIWRCICCKQNPTTNDLFDVYETSKDDIDSVLKVKENHSKGGTSVPTLVYVGAAICSMDGIPTDRFVNTANNYTNDDAHEPIWKALKDWSLEWRSMTDPKGEYLQNEPYDMMTRVALRYSVIRDYLCGKRITPIKNIDINSRSELCNTIRTLIRKRLMISDND